MLLFRSWDPCCGGFWQYQTLLPLPLNSCLAFPSLYRAIHLSCWPTTSWSLRSWSIPFKLHSSLISLNSPSLFLLTIFALHKLLPEWSSGFCTEETSHRTNLPSCCFSHRLLFSLSLFSWALLPKFSLHRLRTERAGKCCLRLIIVSSPFLISPHFLCLDYCLWGQKRFFFFDTVQIIWW